jgi:hypothetical protein
MASSRCASSPVQLIGGDEEGEKEEKGRDKEAKC